MSLIIAASRIVSYSGGACGTWINGPGPLSDGYEGGFSFQRKDSAWAVQRAVGAQVLYFRMIRKVECVMVIAAIIPSWKNCQRPFTPRDSIRRTPNCDV